MRPYRMQLQKDQQPLQIGYYPFRGKVQIVRLLCQYLHINYTDHLFTPEQWIGFKQNQARQWIIKDLPFCKDKSFVVTGGIAIMHYILQKYGRSDLLGRTLDDQLKIAVIRSNQDIRNLIFGLTCFQKSKMGIQELQKKQQFWKQIIYPLLIQYQKMCPEQGWYFGYITIMDFFCYQIINQVKYCFSQNEIGFKNLKGLHSRVYNIKQIRNYQNSSRSIKQYSPVSFFNKFKQQKLKIINNV